MPFTIVEKQSDVGGTWLANRYPGCRVDIANQYYAYSFEPTDHWTHYYSEQPEILKYLKDVADPARASLRRAVRHRGDRRHWDEESATLAGHDPRAPTAVQRR